MLLINYTGKGPSSFPAAVPKLNSDFSFVILHEKPTRPQTPTFSGGPLSHRLKVLQKLTDLAVGNTTIKMLGLDTVHPLCQECADLLLDALARRQAELTRERERYAEFLGRVQSALPIQEERARLENELEKLERNKQICREQLDTVELHVSEVEQQLITVQQEELELEEQEQQFWEQWNLQQEKLRRVRDIEILQRQKVKKYESDFERLKKTNVWNDVFRIVNRGKVASICGLQLGRVPGEPVDWAEINAAWGMAALLLHTLACRLNFTFHGYRIIPLGSFSRIEKIAREQSRMFFSSNDHFELFGSGELYGFRRNSRFEQGMTAFLACLQQLGDFVEQQDSSFRLPHR